MSHCPTCGSRARALSSGRWQYLVPAPEGSYGGLVAKAYVERAVANGLETDEAKVMAADLLHFLEGIGDDLDLSEGYPP